MRSERWSEQREKKTRDGTRGGETTHKTKEKPQAASERGGIIYKNRDLRGNGWLSSENSRTLESPFTKSKPQNQIKKETPSDVRKKNMGSRARQKEK